MHGTRRRIELPRETLLVEIERRCGNPLCKARARTGLTKEDARAYRGFECERCGKWTIDKLAERDVPEWWEELTRTVEFAAAGENIGGEAYEPSEVIMRINDTYRQAHTSRDDQGEQSL
ncbi:MAG: hypothetical protein H0T92_16060 [Pyrinomonadaceae bacterium]|nr:hypothetical protein [Pyrinomonadaceae bacterium]